MPSEIKCITFDLDDTLWEVAPVILRAERRFYDWLQQHCPRITDRYSPDALIDHRTSYISDYPELHHNLTQLRKNWVGELAREAGYDRSLVEPGFRVFWEARNDVSVFKEALDALDSLSGIYRLGAITNGNADVHFIGIGHHFDFVVTSESVGAAKPHPDIFHAALEQAEAAPQEVLHVGDDPKRDVWGAAQVGLRTVWVNAVGNPWPGGPEPDGVIRRLDELEPILLTLTA